VVAITERDGRAVEFVGAQYAVHADLLAAVLGRLAPDRPQPEPLARRTARGWADRMQRAGYLARHRLAGRTWLAATSAGLRLVGLPGEAWRPSLWPLAHLHAVAVVRLDLETSYPGVVWTSERAIRSEWAGTGARVRYSDGVLELPDGGRIGVEVELERKGSRRLPDRSVSRYAAIVRDVDPSLVAVWWFCPAGVVDGLRRKLAEVAPSGPPVHRVGPLPAGAVL
jgi:hypothetical protein